MDEMKKFMNLEEKTPEMKLDPYFLYLA